MSLSPPSSPPPSPLAPGDPDALRQWLREQCADCLGVPAASLATDVPLTDYGMTSVTGTALCGVVEEYLGVECDLGLLWQEPTIDGLTVRLASRTVR
ncbi:acyl carrier protein [Streptomyces exfoliatus]|uniref:acyl carrier protein n=1 Tax=Streptomyces exfoliatus TaxID=1905 RepID=UPI0005666EBE|nr:acyl carrier protein [Streptomyces exfoliatus]